MFLTDNPALIKKLRAKAGAGVKIRLLLGDPTSRAVARRSDEEGIGKGTIAAKVRNALLFYKPLDGVPGISIRCHGTTLHNSIYRFDDDMLVNTHVYGFMAAHVPMLHLRRLSGGDLFETFSESFDNGIAVEVSGLIGVYSDPEHVIEFSDGEVRQEFLDLLPRRTPRWRASHERRIQRGPVGGAR